MAIKRKGAVLITTNHNSTRKLVQLAARQMVYMRGRISVLNAALNGPPGPDTDRICAECDALTDLADYIDCAFDSLPHAEAQMAKFAFYIDWDTPHARIPRYSQFLRWKWMNKVCEAIDAKELEVRWQRASTYIKEGR